MVLKYATHGNICYLLGKDCHNLAIFKWGRKTFKENKKENKAHGSRHGAIKQGVYSAMWEEGVLCFCVKIKSKNCETAKKR